MERNMDFIEELKERFLRYVAFDTQSDPESETFPSTAKQLALLNRLVEEMISLGMTEVEIDPNGYVTGTVPGHAGVRIETRDRLHRACRYESRHERGGHSSPLDRALRRRRYSAERLAFDAGEGFSRALFFQGSYADRDRRYDVARGRRQGRRGRDHDGGGLAARPSRDSARQDPHRIHSRRGDRPGSGLFRREALRGPFRLHGGRRLRGRTRV